MLVSYLCLWIPASLPEGMELKAGALFSFCSNAPSCPRYLWLKSFPVHPLVYILEEFASEMLHSLALKRIWEYKRIGLGSCKIYKNKKHQVMGQSFDKFQFMIGFVVDFLSIILFSKFKFTVFLGDKPVLVKSWVGAKKSVCITSVLWFINKEAGGGRDSRNGKLE